MTTMELMRPRGIRRPFRAVDDMVGRFFEDILTPRAAAGDSRGWAPAIDMLDRKDEIVLRADLPGLDQKDIEVRVENGILTIQGQRQEEHEAKEDDYYHSERWVGSFSRSITLPPGVDTDRIKATYKNGVLEIQFPKTQSAMGKKIEIKAA